MMENLIMTLFALQHQQEQHQQPLFLSNSCLHFRLAGLSSTFLAAEKNNKMLRKNQYLLLPHVPNRGDKIDALNSSSSSSSNSSFSSSYNNNNETSDMNDMHLQHTLNHNFLMEQNSENGNLAVLNENDENYFEIFKTPMKFGTENNTEVTAQIGTTAHLPCTIHNIGEGVVSNYKHCSTLIMLMHQFECIHNNFQVNE
jgi:hypothetical protein